jgi:hypothetical protein
VLAKHSKSFSLVDYLSVGVDRMQRNFEPMRKQVKTWQASELTNITAENLNPALCSRIAAGTCDPNNPGLLRSPTSFINDGRQFFVKLSYLFRP